MTRVKASEEFPVDADTLWQEIGSFQGVGDWHPMLTSVSGFGETTGSVRNVTSRDGQKQIERLREINRSEHYYRYDIISTQMPISQYKGELRVHDSGDRTSRVVWSSAFRTKSGDESKTAEMVRQFLQAGLDSLKSRYTDRLIQPSFG
jgi:mxaD protein